MERMEIREQPWITDVLSLYNRIKDSREKEATDDR